MYNEEKLCSVRSLVVVHTLNFQRDLVVMRFIRIGLIMCSTSMDRDKVCIRVVRDVLQAKCLEFEVHIYVVHFVWGEKKNQVGLVVLSWKLGVPRACP